MEKTVNCQTTVKPLSRQSYCHTVTAYIDRRGRDSRAKVTPFLPGITEADKPRELTIAGHEMEATIASITARGGMVVGAEVPRGCVSSWRLRIHWPDCIEHGVDAGGQHEMMPASHPPCSKAPAQPPKRGRYRSAFFPHETQSQQGYTRI